MQPELPKGCPSVLALERYVSGDLSASVRAHVAECTACGDRVESMRHSAAEFSSSVRSLDALRGTVAADRRWKRNAMALVLAPVVGVAVALGASFASRAEEKPVEVARVTPAEAPVRRAQGRAVLEPRAAPAPRLRQVSLRGRTIDLGEGVLEGAAANGETQPFLLKHTEVDATLTGFIASVTVTQEFENPFHETVEAIYVFPLPDDSAVDAMSLTAGALRLEAKIQKREDARRIYEEAKSQGKKAALLDQERPNLFTQSVASLAPGERVKVTLHFISRLRFDDGQFSFNFPMTVGPRYIPGSPVPGQSQGNGLAPDTDRVLDASRITPAPMRRGDIQVRVHLDAASTIEELASYSHRLLVEKTSTRSCELSLAPEDQLPNKDLMLRWRVSGPENRAAVMAGNGTFALMVVPQVQNAQAPVTPKELVFLIDSSCSMGGAPLEAAKEAMTLALTQMRAEDTFMVMDFADRVSSFHDAPLPATGRNVERALAYLKALPASGGTHQLDGIRRVMQLPKDPNRLRIALLMTDGFIGNEAEVLDAAQVDLGRTRLFTLGIGNSVNHYLLSRLAEVGRGTYEVVRDDQNPSEAVGRFVRRIARPLLTDVEIDWGGLDVVDVLPRQVPDLFDAQPLVVVGRYRKPGRAVVTVRGLQRGLLQETKVEVLLPDGMGAPGLPSLWARAKIEALERTQYGGERAETISKITTLGLEHHLVTPYTSFVAADEARGAEAGEPMRVLQQKRMNTIQVIRGAPAPVVAQPVARTTMPTIPPVVNVEPGYFQTQKAGGEDEFSSAFGSAAPDGKPARQGGSNKPEVYIPPAPGGGASTAKKRSLEPADILEVIVSHKAGLIECAAEQRKREPGVSGKLTMKWSIKTDGTPFAVSVLEDEFKATYFASCVGALIKSWTFPKHLVQGEPVLFPFKF